MNQIKSHEDEYKHQQLQCAHIIETARSHPETWKIISVHSGQKHFIRELNETKKTIWIVDEFKGEYHLDFLMEESIDAIIELVR